MSKRNRIFAVVSLAVVVAMIAEVPVVAAQKKPGPETRFGKWKTVYRRMQ